MTGVGVPVPLNMMATQMASDLGSRAVLTPQVVEPPAEGKERLQFTFEDTADPGGTVLVLLRHNGESTDLVMGHALFPHAEALHQAAGFLAGWAAFLDLLNAALTGRPVCDVYEALIPSADAQAARLGRVVAGTCEAGVVRHERSIRATPDAVWVLLTEPDGLGAWLGDVVKAPTGPASEFVVQHDAVTRQRSVVGDWRPHEALSWTWQVDPEPESHVSFRLVREADATRLVLEHSGLGDDAAEYRTGWHAHLDPLVAAAEGDQVPPYSPAFAAAEEVYR